MTKLMAFYLPQFHRIPENDLWWGEGFTEWSNVRAGRPQFAGHRQPKIPLGENYYDLSRPHVLCEQAELARRYGIHGFVFYHYWFKGKRLLEGPLQTVLENQSFTLPFCLCWANENWSRRWDGLENDVLIEQQYSCEDDLEHIRALLPVLKDSRYYRHLGRPVVLVYRSEALPNAAGTAALWREEAKHAGLPGLYLLRVEGFLAGVDPAQHGFDAAVEFAPDWRCLTKRHYLGADGQWRLPLSPTFSPVAGTLENQVFMYDDVVRAMLAKEPPTYQRYPGVFPAWDNHARRRKDAGATIIHDSSPEKYERFLTEVISRAERLAPAERLVFINAWNEWGEGCYLEADQEYGHAYLAATAAALKAGQRRKLVLPKDPKPGLKSEVKRERGPFPGPPPLVSVIIPAYNHERWIKETLDSVLNQSFRELEVIVIDDGSTDNTAALVAACEDHRVCLQIQNNQGTAAALNRGLTCSRGRYLAILNSDDLFLPERLSHFVEVLEANPRFALAFSQVRLVDSDSLALQQGFELEWLKHAEGDFAHSQDLLLSLLRDNFLCTSSNFFFRRSLLCRIGAFRPLRYVNDLDFLLRALLRHEAYFCERELLAYRLHSGNTLKEKGAGRQLEFLLELSWVLAHALENGALMPQWSFAELARLLTGYYRINLESLFLAMLYLRRQKGVFLAPESLPPAVRDCLHKCLRQRLDENVYRDNLVSQVAEQKSYINEQLAYIEKLEEGRRFFLGQIEGLEKAFTELQKLTQFREKEFSLRLQQQDQEFSRLQQVQQELWDACEWYRRQQEALLSSRRFRLVDNLQALARGQNPLYHARELLRILLPLSWFAGLRSARDRLRQAGMNGNSWWRWGRRWLRRLSALLPARAWRQSSHAGPLLSIILPCFNHGAFLDDLSASLKAQTFTDFEVILIDDGSSDPATVCKIDAIEREQRPGWKVIRQLNRGVIGARNRAIGEARGRYIFPLDTDDTIAPTFLEKTLFLLETLPDHFFVYTWTNVVGDEPYLWRTENSDPEKILNENRIGVAIFPRRAWETVGGYNEIMRDGYEDWEFYVNLVRHGYVGRVIPEALYNYRMLAGSRNERASAASAGLQRRIRDLHLGYIMNHLRILRGRVRQRWQVMNGLVNLNRGDGAKLSAFRLDLRGLSFSPAEIFPRLLAFAESADKPLLVTADSLWRDFFYFNQLPGLRVYFPEYYHSEREPQLLVRYLEGHYRIEKIGLDDLSKVETGGLIESVPVKGRQKLRILYLAPWVITGGADTMLVDWFRRLDAGWCDKFLVTTLPRENLWLAKVAGHAREIYDLPALGCREQAAINGFLLDFIGRRRIDIIHIMNSEAGFQALPTLKKHYPALKVVAQFHCFDHFPDGRRTGYALEVPRLYDQHIDRYNLEYEHLGKELRGLYPYLAEDKFTVIHGRVDAAYYDPARRAARSEIARERVDGVLNLLYVGRLDRQKQPLRLLEIAASLKKMKKSFVLHIVGDGNLESQKKELLGGIRQQHLEREVRWHGEQPLSSVYDWYKIADLLLLTSDWEGVPMVLYQAMAMAVVPVVAEVGGCAELVTPECGFLIRERERPEAYVAAISKLADPHRRQRMAAAARRRMCEDFSLAGLDREYQSFYFSLKP